jgi:hypothetical protein
MSELVTKMYGEEKSTKYIRYQSTHSHPSKEKMALKIAVKVASVNGP